MYSLLGDKKMGILAHNQNNPDIHFITKLISSKKLEVSIDKTFDFLETKKAFEYLIKGNAKGKVIIRIP